MPLPQEAAQPVPHLGLGELDIRVLRAIGIVIAIIIIPVVIQTRLATIPGFIVDQFGDLLDDVIQSVARSNRFPTSPSNSSESKVNSALPERVTEYQARPFSVSENSTLMTIPSPVGAPVALV